MTRMFRDLARLLRSWWRCDRIRVAPREGRLLRLNPRDRLIVRGVAATIVRRTLKEIGGEPVVDYDCDSDTGRLVMRVPLSRSERAAVLHSSLTVAHALSETEIDLVG